MPEGPYIGVGAVIVRDGRLLMVQRGKDPAKGLWSVPGGRLERGEHIADAIAREVKEETGLDVEVRELVGVFEVPGDTHYVILDHLADVVGDPAPVASGDAADARWVPFDEIESLDCTPRFGELMRAWGILP